MSLHRRNPRRDANEPAIVDALLAAGATIYRLSGKGQPDLLVRFRGIWTPLEVKTTTGRLTKAQAAIDWPIVRSVEDALTAIGCQENA